MLSILISPPPWGKFPRLAPSGGALFWAITYYCCVGKGLVGIVGCFGCSLTYWCTSLRHGQSLVL